MRPSLFTENFIQHHSALSTLPPLWEVIYQEAMRGNHLLFRKSDVELYEAREGGDAFWENADLTDELEITVLKLIGSADLQAMTRVVDELENEQRRHLYAFYRRALWLWQHYVKARLN